MDLQFSEVIDVAVALTGVPLLAMMSQRIISPAGRPWLFLGYICVLAAGVLTIAEGVGGQSGEWLNLAEHAFLMFAGLSFVTSAWQARKSALVAERLR